MDGRALARSFTKLAVHFTLTPTHTHWRTLVHHSSFAIHALTHACPSLALQPSCIARVINVRGEPRIAIYAKRNIEIGEEITYDYKFPIEVRCVVVYGARVPPCHSTCGERWNLWMRASCSWPYYACNAKEPRARMPYVGTDEIGVSLLVAGGQDTLPLRRAGLPQNPQLIMCSHRDVTWPPITAMVGSLV